MCSNYQSGCWNPELQMSLMHHFTAAILLGKESEYFSKFPWCEKWFWVCSAEEPSSNKWPFREKKLSDLSETCTSNFTPDIPAESGGGGAAAAAARSTLHRRVCRLTMSIWRFKVMLVIILGSQLSARGQEMNHLHLWSMTNVYDTIHQSIDGWLMRHLSFQKHLCPFFQEIWSEITQKGYPCTVCIKPKRFIKNEMSWNWNILNSTEWCLLDTN